ncbi:hypothetical protein G5I_11343 [Acromyrmex echinatior]|uniref:Uncharacterized protein n=1 Tax=Acromyrmex echinatior TaxID=103372 RepID=F4WZC5_ACREC|nr:hypothetical protein G5I_11343 [Acromyrmex echinatior]
MERVWKDGQTQSHRYTRGGEHFEHILKHILKIKISIFGVIEVATRTILDCQEVQMSETERLRRRHVQARSSFLLAMIVSLTISGLDDGKRSGILNAPTAGASEAATREIVLKQSSDKMTSRSKMISSHNRAFRFQIDGQLTNINEARTRGRPGPAAARHSTADFAALIESSTNRPIPKGISFPINPVDEFDSRLQRGNALLQPEKKIEETI